jgi:aerobic-type carbon monoxide dehydrogenase small subunit (CoxS/CutS family)
MTEEKKKESGVISRREFLKDAGLVVGSAAIGSTVLLAACGGEKETVSNTVTTTAPGSTSTKTVTTTAGEVTKTETKTVSKFVCPYDGQELDTLAELQEHIEAEHGGESQTTLNVIRFSANRSEHEVQVEPNWTLRDVLRQKIGLTSIKDFCNGYGACGSCCVLMNGRSVLSCMVLAIECNGAVIETAEGIADENHPLVEAYIMNWCAQCGYCTPGFLVTAKSLLDKNPDPTEDDIKEALSGNLCRCGTYPVHVTAILEAAEQLKEVG